MAVVVRHVTFGSQTHPIVLNSNALFKIEEQTGLSTERIAMTMAVGRAGFRIAQILLWAALEAGRVREKTRREPFTIEEVGNLLDEEGGSAVVWAGEDDGYDEELVDGKKVRRQVREPRPLHPIATEFMAAWEAAFPKQKRVEEASRPPDAAGTE